jgi:CSLREA domain-containing protein
VLRITTSKILHIIAAVAILGGLVLGVSSTHAATITVTTTADENNSDGDCSLREAVIAANKNRAIDACVAGSATSVDTILVPAGDYLFLIPEAGGDADTGDLDLTDDVSIVGSGRAATVIHANGLDRVFSVDSPGVESVRISSLTLTGGPGVVGTASYADWASLDLVNVRLTGATGTLSVVYFIGEALTITDSRIDSNVGAGLFLNSADATAVIRNTIISQNHGGGIISAGALELVNVTLSGNSTKGDGGGLDARGGSVGL